ncbi:MAG: hypothetical protein GX364_03430 [Firmicutes bacterium]|jgi:CBS domain containing-hemolysin-like protein|nr:hypothetical protein [Bacillota bacterium]
MAIGTFLLAIVFGVASQLLLQKVFSLYLALLILIVVVLIGIVFDGIGTAAAAAKMAPLNAKASRKIEGARKAVQLVKNADRVANFCNDVIGDIAGIVSGAVSAVIFFNLFFFEEEQEFYLRILLTAAVAAVTVGGKAWGKNRAIRKSTEIMLALGLLLTRLERILPCRWGVFRKDK